MNKEVKSRWYGSAFIAKPLVGIISDILFGIPIEKDNNCLEKGTSVSRLSKDYRMRSGRI